MLIGLKNSEKKREKRRDLQTAEKYLDLLRLFGMKVLDGDF